jgi:hypothetical protein
MYPNLADCWISYLELKKKHYEKITTEHCDFVLERMGEATIGMDLKKEDVIRLLIYKNI